MSYVYFLQIQPDGPIKIGFTKGNVARRVKALQHSSPHVMKWIGGFSAGKEQEAYAHRLLANSRCRSEWFYPTLEVLAFISEKCPAFDEVVVRDEVYLEQYRSVVRELIPSYRRATESTIRDVLEASGLNTYEFWKWMSRARAPDPEQARKAAEFASKRLLERSTAPRSASTSEAA